MKIDVIYSPLKPSEVSVEVDSFSMIDYRLNCDETEFCDFYLLSSISNNNSTLCSVCVCTSFVSLVSLDVSKL